MKDYYKILGVSQSASLATIKGAYRSKAKLYHPDISSDNKSKEQFQLINEAYQVLHDERKRRLYDNRLQYRSHRKKTYYRKGRSPYSDVSYKQKQYYNKKQQDYSSQQYHRFERVFDNFLFIFMIIVGLYAIGFGFFRLFYAPVDGVNPLAGIISGTVFTIVIIYGWICKIKSQY